MNAVADSLRGKLQAVTVRDMANFFAIYLAFGVTFWCTIEAFYRGNTVAYFAACVAVQFATAWAWKPPFEPWEI